MNTKTETVKVTNLADEAIAYVLQRIRVDENIRYHMGPFTEAFERLKAAHAAVTGLSEEAIEERILGYELKLQPAAQIVKELEHQIHQYQAYELTQEGALVKICGILEIPLVKGESR